MKFSSKAKGKDAQGRAFRVAFAGELDAPVPDEGFLGLVDLAKRCVLRALKQPPAAEVLAADPTSLSAVVTQLAAPELEPEGLQGAITLTFVRVELLAAARDVAVDVPPPAPAALVTPALGRPPTDQTALATPALTDEPALPFRGEAAPPPAATDEGPHVGTGETAFVSALDVEEALPFESEVPELTVEQYASLCVERTMHPGQQGDVAKRYKVLTEQALRALDERFRQRFATQGELLQRYQQAYARYEAWVREQKK